MQSSKLAWCFPLALTLTVAGCAPPHQHEEEQETDGPEPTGEAVSAVTVGEAASGGCSTSSVKGLSLQIIAQAACLKPGSFVEVAAGGNLTYSSTVLPYLEQPAKDALLAALADKPGTGMQVNSMLRTVAQQYLLYTWYLNNQCGIALAAKPGNSNHETGIALDVQQYSTWKTALTNHGFKWFGNSDTVHFDYVGAGAVNYKGADVLAFQTLWNKNHPEDVIGADGAYGPQTEARLKKSPAGGFAKGPECDVVKAVPDLQPALAFIDAEDGFADGASAGRADLFEGDDHAVELLLSNTGGAAASAVDIEIEIAEPHLAGLDYFIETDYGHPGTFEENDANSDPANPAHGSALGPSFSLKMNAFSKGETKRVTLTLHADAYSIEKDVAPDVRFWVKDIPGAYHQDTFGGAADNIDGSQTFNGGKLELSAPADVYSHSQWLWDTDRREGWEALGTADIAFDPDQGTLSMTPAGGSSGPLVQSPLLSLPAAEFDRIELYAPVKGGNRAFLYFATTAAPDFDETRRVALDFGGADSLGGTSVDVSDQPLWTGTITRIGLGADAGNTGLTVDWLRLVPSTWNGGAGGDGSGGNGGSGGFGGGRGGNAAQTDAANCTCTLPGASPSSPGGGRDAAMLAMGLLGLIAARRGRRLVISTKK